MKREEDKKMQMILKAGIAVALVLFAILIVIIVKRLPLEVRTMDVRFNVDGTLGADLNGSALTFGNIFPGSIATRKIEVSNNRDFPVEVLFFASEEVAPYLVIENATLQAKEKAFIPITITIPEDLPYGNYSGKLKIVIDKIEVKN